MTENGIQIPIQNVSSLYPEVFCGPEPPSESFYFHVGFMDANDISTSLCVLAVDQILLYAVKHPEILNYVPWSNFLSKNELKSLTDMFNDTYFSIKEDGETIDMTQSQLPINPAGSVGSAESTESAEFLHRSCWSSRNA